MTTVCKKCGYQRQTGDTAPEYECPSCGAVYAKVEAHLRRQAEEREHQIAEAIRREKDEEKETQREGDPEKTVGEAFAPPANPVKKSSFLPWALLLLGSLIVMTLLDDSPDDQESQRQAPAEPLASTPTTFKWSPSDACGFLYDVGFATGRYRPEYPGSQDYVCLSEMKPIGIGYPLPNNLAYYVKGRDWSARELKLVLNINQPDVDTEARERMVYAAQTLTRAATGRPLPVSVEDEIRFGTVGSWRVGDRRLRFLREDWPDGERYELKFTID